MIEDKSLIDTYIANGIKIVRAKGYHKVYNPNRDYKVAKQSVDSAYTSEDFAGATSEEAFEWLNESGWIGALFPSNIIILDFEDEDKKAQIDELNKSLNLSPSIQNTQNGWHYIYKIPESVDLSSNPKVKLKLGIEVTYRVGGRNYIIVEPSPDRNWECFYDK